MNGSTRILGCILASLVMLNVSTVIAQNSSFSRWPSGKPTMTNAADYGQAFEIESSGNSVVIPRPAVPAAQAQPHCERCGGQCDGSCGNTMIRPFCGVDGFGCRPGGKEPTWQDERLIPWEAFAYGEYIGPHRTPHVSRYRIRVNDQIEFVYQATREQTSHPYRLMVGDRILISSSTDPELNQGGELGITVLSDGSVSLRLVGRVIAARKTIQELQNELNERYSEFFAEGADPAIVVSGHNTDTQLQDLINAVDARFGNGGQSRQASVSPDGTIQLPMLGSVSTIGLTLDELAREVNMRYRQKVQGIEVTPILANRAPRFIYVLGEVATSGRFELTGPTSAMQAVALAGGWNAGGNIRQIIVFRRDHNWQLMALRLDLAGGLHGKRPLPSDEIWLRDSDIVLVPKLPIQRLADAIDLYFTRTLYSLFPNELGSFDGGAGL